MFYLNMVDCPLFFPSLHVQLDLGQWDTFLTLRPFNSYGVGWLAHKILMTAQRPNSLFLFLFSLGLDFELGLVLGPRKSLKIINCKYLNL